MGRYIDADALKEWIDEYVSVFKKSDTREIKGYIEHQPTIDAVSVVRCKECKHNYNKVLNHGKMQPRCDFTDRKLSEDDYCSRGEREGE